MAIKFELLEGRIHGARYYSVRPLNEWFMTGGMSEDPFSTWSNMSDWCTEAFGAAPIDGIWDPGHRWYENNAKFWFRNEQDRTLFLLRFA